MRKLASQANQASGQIQKSVGELENALHRSLSGVADLVRTVEGFEQDMGRVGETVEETRRRAGQVGEAVLSLTTALEEQSAVTQETVQRVTYILGCARQTERAMATTGKALLSVRALLRHSVRH